MSRVSEHISDELLQDFIEGILPPNAEERIAAHIFSCSTCEKSYHRVNGYQMDEASAKAAYRQVLIGVEEQQKKINNPPSIVKPLYLKWLMAAAVATILAISGLIWLRADAEDPVELAQSFSLKFPGIGPTAGSGSDVWIVQYSSPHPNWKKIIGSLEEQILEIQNDLQSGGSQQLQDTNTIKLIVYGEALNKVGKDPRDLLRLITKHSNNQLYTTAATFYQGLYLIQQGQIEAGLQQWEGIRLDPHLPDAFHTEIEKIESAATLPPNP